MSRILFLLALCLCGMAVGAEPKVPMRAPFVLTLHVDKDSYYEEKIGAMPYVLEGNVYLMKGDKFGVSLEMANDEVKSIAYQPDFEKADLTFAFSQEADEEGGGMMMLRIHNRTSHRLVMRALMTVPGRKGTSETSIVPVEPGLTNFESWPHPIVKLLLHDIQVGK